MKKIIFILLLISSYAHGQGKVYTRCGTPTGTITNFVKNRDIAWDSCANLYYMQRSDLKYYIVNFAKGQKGDTGPAGPQGIPGTSGTGASADCLPVSFGGKTFAQLGLSQSFIDVNYPGYGLTVNDTRDLAELMACEKSGKPISLTADMGIDKGWLIPKTKYFLELNLKAHTIYSTNSNPFSLIYCDLPNDMGEANAMANRTFIINGPGLIKGSRTQVGIRVGAGSGHVYNYIEYEGLKTGNWHEFSMEGIENRPRFTRCINGAILDYYRNLPNSPEMSPCNNFTLNTPKYWTDQAETTGICIGVYAAQGVTINAPTLQGGNLAANATFLYGIDFDDAGVGPVKLFVINNAYEEIQGGVTGAYIRLKMRDGSFILNGALGHHPGILLDSKLSAGSTNIAINYVPYFKRKNGKLFDTVAGGPAYAINYSKLASDGDTELNTQNYKTLVSQLFVTPSTISFCGDAPNTNCGYGKYTVTLNGR